MISTELSNAVFRLVLRCAGAEIDGGCSNTPHQVVENPEAHQGTGLKKNGMVFGKCVGMKVTKFSGLRVSNPYFC